MTSPAQELRTAAQTLRDLIRAVGSEAWSADHFPEGTIVRPANSTVSLLRLAADGARAAGTPHVTAAVGAYIAAMGPNVGLALVKLLEDCADLHEPHEPGNLLGFIPPGCQWCADEDFPCSDMRNALAVARAINTGGHP